MVDERGGKMKIRLGHSPDPDDAFMFYGLATGKMDAGPYAFEHILQDIQTLNERAMKGELEVSAISLHAYPYVAKQYALMGCGCSMGENYGPIIVAKKPYTIEELKGKRIAIPGTMTTAFLSHLVETRGAVINIGSVQSFVALPNSAAYTASKGGVRALTKALAIELSPLGVRVNAIGPGMIATPLNAKARENPDYMRNFKDRIPLGRLGEPDDVARVVSFLASSESDWINGQVIKANGGRN